MAATRLVPRRAASLGARTSILVGGQATLGALLARAPFYAVSMTAACVLPVISILVPSVGLMAPMVGVFGYWRVGPASLSLSLADVVIGLSVVGALLQAPWSSPIFQRALRVLATYLVILGVSVALVGTQRGYMEWAHRLFLVGGSLTIGSAIGRAGLAERALRIYVLASATFALRAIFDALRSGFQPAYPFGLHKNAAGFFFSCALVVLLLLGQRVAPRAPLRWGLTALVVAGVLCCQSRSAAATITVVLLWWSLRQRRGALTFAVVVFGVAVAVMAYATAAAMFTEDNADSRFNSLNSRVTTYEATMELWRERPVEGLGLRYWRDPALAGQLAFGEPHNLVVAALGESGLIGLGALAFLIIGTMAALRGRDPLTRMVRLLLVAKTIDSLLGIFWVAGTLTLPWLMVGLALGAKSCSDGVTGSDDEDDHAKDDRARRLTSRRGEALVAAPRGR